MGDGPGAAEQAGSVGCCLEENLCGVALCSLLRGVPRVLFLVVCWATASPAHGPLTPRGAAICLAWPDTPLPAPPAPPRTAVPYRYWPRLVTSHCCCRAPAALPGAVRYISRACWLPLRNARGCPRGFPKSYSLVNIKMARGGSWQQALYRLSSSLTAGQQVSRF